MSSFWTPIQTTRGGLDVGTGLIHSVQVQHALVGVAVPLELAARGHHKGFLRMGPKAKSY